MPRLPPEDVKLEQRQREGCAAVSVPASSTLWILSNRHFLCAASHEVAECVQEQGV